MANPNILNASVVEGENSLISATTTPQVFINNAASSGKIYKVNSLIASNITGNIDSEITVSIYSQDDIGGTEYKLARTITVPSTTSLIVIDKTTSVYLKEDQSIGVYASGNTEIVCSSSWDEIG
jgi:hypothetical protein